MQDGKRGIETAHRPDGLLVTIKDEPDVPDWPERVAKMKKAAESITNAMQMLRDATKDTRWFLDGEDIARQLLNLVETDHDGNSVLDLVNDIVEVEEVHGRARRHERP
jgi:hypothetical protein